MEQTAYLDNPIWYGLRTHHAQVAEEDNGILRYRSDVAPFYAVQDEGAQVGPNDPLREGEQPYFIGTLPQMPAFWRVLRRAIILQMVHAGAAAEDGAVQVVTLGDADLEQMLALTALVYPLYFRRGTPLLGRYVGVKQDGRLVAMAGERLHPGSCQEISGICTHPDYTRRGYARALTAHLVRGIAARGETPFLHVDAGNARAHALYEKLGFAGRRELALVQVGTA